MSVIALGISGISSQNNKSFNFEIGSKRKLIFARRNRISNGDKDMIVICGWYEDSKMRVLFIFSNGDYTVKEAWEDNTIYSKVG